MVALVVPQGTCQTCPGHSGPASLAAVVRRRTGFTVGTHDVPRPVAIATTYVSKHHGRAAGLCDVAATGVSAWSLPVTEGRKGALQGAHTADFSHLVYCSKNDPLQGFPLQRSLCFLPCHYFWILNTTQKKSQALLGHSSNVS